MTKVVVVVVVDDDDDLLFCCPGWTDLVEGACALGFNLRVFRGNGGEAWELV